MGKIVSLPRTNHRRTWPALLFLLSLLPSALPAQERAPERPLNILLLSSYSQNYASAQELQAGLNDVLNYRAGTHNMYVEYFDSARIPDEKTGRNFAEHLRAKYEDIRFDHVLVWHVTAINFIHQHPDLFPDAKVISFEGPRMADTGDESWFNVEQDFDGALAEVKRLYAPSKLYVILETVDVNARTRLSNFERAHALHMPEVPVEYLTDRPLAEVTELLEREHPRGTAAIYLLSFTSISGQPTSPNDVYIWLSARTTIPIFSFWQTLLGNGLPGGLVFSHRQAGRSVGHIVLEPETVDLMAPLDTDILAYDWQLLEKWGIDTDLVPEGTLVINRPENILYTYRYEVSAVAVTLLLLTGLSLTLAKAVFTRNLAVAELRVERQSLESTVAERTRDLAQANEVLNQKNAELQQSLSEVKTLQGFIPICSYCKNVRHDQGYWQQVEAYISAQTDARFSHSICPKCLTTHFPDVHLS
jgi:hypothetical protein